jgi:uncharacterized protein YciI
MIIAMLTYIKPIEEIDTYLVAHRAFLDEGYEKGYLLVSGPRIPRTGGILISPLKDKDAFMHYLSRDPFYVEGLVNYELISFDPIKKHPVLATLLE